MLIFTLLATTTPATIDDDQEASLNGNLDDFEHDPDFYRFGTLPAECSKTSEKNIWHIDDLKEQAEWLEAAQDDDGALPRKALDYANEMNPEGGFDLYDDIAELKAGSFSKRVWRSSAGDQCLYVVKLWKKNAMSAFNRSVLASHNLSDMKRLSFLTTTNTAFQRLSFLMDQQQNLEMNPPIRVLIPCALIVVGHGDNAEFIEISECASGKSLEDMIKSHSNAPGFLLDLFFSAGQQLALLHQDKHTIHGDLSPGNMFVNEDTHVFSWIDTQSVCILGDGDHSHQYEEEVRTMVGYLMRGYDEETAVSGDCSGGTAAAATTISPRAAALKKFEGGFNIPDALKKQLAEAFIDGYIANLRTNTSPALKRNIQHMRSALLLSRRGASPAGLTDTGSLDSSILSQ